MNITNLPNCTSSSAGILSRSLANGAIGLRIVLEAHNTTATSEDTIPKHSLCALRALHRNAIMTQQLQAWEKKPNITTSEKTNRAIAAEKIQKCYDQTETWLDLSDLGLSSLPDLSYLSSVTHLLLERNQLTSFSGQGLSSLTHLGLDRNQLTSFSGQGLSSLTSLRLGENRLTSFSNITLPSPNTLRDIWLANNPFMAVARESQNITMRIPTGIIEDFPESLLPQYGVEVLRCPQGQTA